MPRPSIVDSFVLHAAWRAVEAQASILAGFYVTADRESRKKLFMSQLEKGQLKNMTEADIDAALDINEKYSQWTVIQISKGNIHLPADSAAVKDALDKFAVQVVGGAFTGSKDLMTYKTLAQLQEQVAKGEVGTKTKEKQQLEEGQRLVGEEGPWKIIEITTPEAAAKLCRGKVWCVKDPKYSKDYLKLGPLYLVLQDGKPVLMHSVRDGFSTLQNETVQIKDPILKKLFEPLLGMGVPWETEKRNKYFEYPGWSEEPEKEDWISIANPYAKNIGVPADTPLQIIGFSHTMPVLDTAKVTPGNPYTLIWHGTVPEFKVVKRGWERSPMPKVGDWIVVTDSRGADASKKLTGMPVRVKGSQSGAFMVKLQGAAQKALEGSNSWEIGLNVTHFKIVPAEQVYAEHPELKPKPPPPPPQTMGEAIVSPWKDVEKGDKLVITQVSVTKEGSEDWLNAVILVTSAIPGNVNGKIIQSPNESLVGEQYDFQSYQWQFKLLAGTGKTPKKDKIPGVRTGNDYPAVGDYIRILTSTQNDDTKREFLGKVFKVMYIMDSEHFSIDAGRDGAGPANTWSIFTNKTTWEIVDKDGKPIQATFGTDKFEVGKTYELASAPNAAAKYVGTQLKITKLPEVEGEAFGKMVKPVGFTPEVVAAWGDEETLWFMDPENRWKEVVESKPGKIKPGDLVAFVGDYPAWKGMQGTVDSISSSSVDGVCRLTVVMPPSGYATLFPAGAIIDIYTKDWKVVSDAAPAPGAEKPAPKEDVWQKVKAGDKIKILKFTVVAGELPELVGVTSTVLSVHKRDNGNSFITLSPEDRPATLNAGIDFILASNMEDAFEIISEAAPKSKKAQLQDPNYSMSESRDHIDSAQTLIPGQPIETKNPDGTVHNDVEVGKESTQKKFKPKWILNEDPSTVYNEIHQSLPVGETMDKQSMLEAISRVRVCLASKDIESYKLANRILVSLIDEVKREAMKKIAAYEWFVPGLGKSVERQSGTLEEMAWELGNLPGEIEGITFGDLPHGTEVGYEGSKFNYPKSLKTSFNIELADGSTLPGHFTKELSKAEQAHLSYLVTLDAKDKAVTAQKESDYIVGLMKDLLGAFTELDEAIEAYASHVNYESSHETNLYADLCGKAGSVGSRLDDVLRNMGVESNLPAVYSQVKAQYMNPAMKTVFEKGFVKVKKHPHSDSRLIGETLADQTVLSNVIGKVGFPIGEYDLVLRKLGGWGLGLEASEELGKIPEAAPAAAPASVMNYGKCETCGGPALLTDKMDKPVKCDSCKGPAGGSTPDVVASVTTEQNGSDTCNHDWVHDQYYRLCKKCHRLEKQLDTSTPESTDSSEGDEPMRLSSFHKVATSEEAGPVHSFEARRKRALEYWNRITQKATNPNAPEGTVLVPEKMDRPQDPAQVTRSPLSASRIAEQIMMETARGFFLSVQEAFDGYTKYGWKWASPDQKAELARILRSYSHAIVYDPKDGSEVANLQMTAQKVEKKFDACPKCGGELEEGLTDDDEVYCRKCGLTGMPNTEHGKLLNDLRTNLTHAALLIRGQMFVVQPLPDNWKDKGLIDAEAPAYKLIDAFLSVLQPAMPQEDFITLDKEAAAVENDEGRANEFVNGTLLDAMADAAPTGTAFSKKGGEYGFWDNYGASSLNAQPITLSTSQEESAKPFLPAADEGTPPVKTSEALKKELNNMRAAAVDSYIDDAEQYVEIADELERAVDIAEQLEGAAETKE